MKPVLSHRNTAFWVCAIASIALLVASFVLPPTGVIDPSVLAGVGELFAFAALWTVIEAIRHGKTATVRKGDTEISVTGDTNQE